MIIILCMAIVVLTGIIIIQYWKQTERSRNIKYISDKLSGIITGNTRENLLMVTDDKELIPLLAAVNTLLENNKKNLAGYLKTEAAMKKMLSNISHDLKTPLTVVMGYIEAMCLDANIQGEERQIALRKVYGKASEVLELIDKFFDLARLESGDKDIPVSKVNMNEICSRNMLAFYDLLSAKGLEADIDIPSNSIYALGNEEALDRVLNNLLSNAIKYGCDGKVVGLSLSSENEFIRVDVWDKGKGIGETYRDKVFERLYTLEDSRNKLYQGSGLGLSITKQLMERMEGEIFLQSKPFEKTVFTIKLKRPYQS